jgi:hypothetical protein
MFAEITEIQLPIFNTGNSAENMDLGALGYHGVKDGPIGQDHSIRIGLKLQTTI